MSALRSDWHGSFDSAEDRFKGMLSWQRHGVISDSVPSIKNNIMNLVVIAFLN